MPQFLYHIHHAVIALGLTGMLIKLYKPSESNKLFDGASLFLYMMAIAIYLTNLRQGSYAVMTGNWGEVDEHTGINVIAASQVFIVLILLGVAGLQLGQFYAEWENARQVRKALEQERKEKEQSKKEK